GDPAQELLHERVLALVEPPPVRLEREHLLAHEGAEERLELRLLSSRERRERRDREALAEHARLLDELPLLGRPASRAATSACSVSGTSSASIAAVGRYAAPSRTSRPRFRSIRTVSTAYNGT